MLSELKAGGIACVLQKAFFNAVRSHQGLASCQRLAFGGRTAFKQNTDAPKPALG
ncbi:hypothetical protein QT970_04790 [Microcoleus sp. herbarium8]|uniref:hypothetical protein n=1 Tax=Microcoleus sp. herbarium8 TaxID=3055436 RepID=UPI002FCE77D0